MDVANLASVELLEATPGGGATARRLGEFWRDAPCVLVFLRHFG
jgi:hypothetical protein